MFWERSLFGRSIRNPFGPAKKRMQFRVICKSLISMLLCGFSGGGIFETKKVRASFVLWTILCTFVHE